MKNVQLGLMKDQLRLDRAKYEARIAVVVKVVAGKLMVVLGRL